jgi:hypothetical protein
MIHWIVLKNLNLGLAIPLCLCDKYYKISTVKHNSFIFYYYVKMFLQKQHVSTHLRGHHQASVVMELRKAVHKQLAYVRDPVRFI